MFAAHGGHVRRRMLLNVVACFALRVLDVQIQIQLAANAGIRGFKELPRAGIVILRGKIGFKISFQHFIQIAGRNQRFKACAEHGIVIVIVDRHHEKHSEIAVLSDIPVRKQFVSIVLRAQIARRIHADDHDFRAGRIVQTLVGEENLALRFR